MHDVELSAVVIALNEERNLPSLIAALDWVDEIVIVDGGSTDRTFELAAGARVRAARRSFDNFAAQRNYGNRLARGRWVLSIDADERPSPALAAEARRRIAEVESVADRGIGTTVAWRLPIRSRIFGRAFRYSGTQGDRPVRLFRRGCGVWVGEVHERFLVEGAIGHFDSHLEHETIPDLPSFLEKMQRYTSLDAAAAVAAGVQPNWLDTGTAPWKEFARRLVYKHGWLDGPEGWAFCALSGLSAWVAANKHRRLWNGAHGSAPVN